jgi:glycosyltransferase involved in cell wall biosynthesis
MTMIEFPETRQNLPKLAVVIPALNERETVGAVIAAVPRRIAGVGSVEVILVDDGSSDDTVAVARAAGADVIASHTRNRGLVAAFNRAVREAIAAGADLVVNLDADGQHDPRFIPRLVAPLLAGGADVVVGVRPLGEASQGSPLRRFGNRLGSALLRRTLRLPVSDFTSGYRAFTREALLQLNIVSDYTYTLETLIQAARKRLAVTEVVVPARKRLHGESRMTGSLVRYISRSGGQAFRSMLHHNPLSVFGPASFAALFVAAAAGGWFLLGYQRGGMHLPALFASLLSALTSGGLFITGLIADGTNTNRRLLEDALYRLKSIESERLGNQDGGLAWREHGAAGRNATAR